MKNILKNLVIFFFILITIAGMFSIYEKKEGETVNNSLPQRITMNEFIAKINNQEIKEIKVEGVKIKLILKDDSQKFVKKETGETFSELIKNYNIDQEKLTNVKIDIRENEGTEYWIMTFLPFLFPILLLGVIIYFMVKGVSGINSKAMMFGQSHVKRFEKDIKERISFKDVAGVKEAKEELKEIVEFLKQPKKFLELGARIPRGVLLLGSPGTGKTLLSRAVAGEANVPFFHISGSEFVEMFVGVGASRVRDLFKTAKKNAPCIVFIDEIDAVGRRRGAGLGGSHDEREQTLNQILVEMDGFDLDTNVIVIAATNRPDVLDPALLRPGRFDRQVILDNPDINDREAILKIHSRKKPLSKEVSLRQIAERTPGFSGADLANLLNESALLAAKNNKKIINMEELYESIEKVMLGPERKSKVLSEEEKKITAYHEAGHALVAHFLPHIDPVQKISIISRGRAGGYILKVPTKDKYMHTKTEYIEEIAVALAGYLTEKEIFNEITTGATSDLRHATSIARQLVTDFGMSNKLGPRTFGTKDEMVFLGKQITEQKDYSEKVAEKIDEEISNFINQGIEKAKDVIISKKDKLEEIVKKLLEKERIEKDEFDEIVS